MLICKRWRNRFYTRRQARLSAVRCWSWDSMRAIACSAPVQPTLVLFRREMQAFGTCMALGYPAVRAIGGRLC